VRGEPHKSGRRIFAASGGKKSSNYFQNRAPFRKNQIFGVSIHSGSKRISDYFYIALKKNKKRSYLESERFLFS